MDDAHVCIYASLKEVPMCISIKDVAKATGVSYSIVSPALSDSPPLKRISKNHPEAPLQR